MIDRTRFAAQGLSGGRPGAVGEFVVDEQPRPPKTVVRFAANALVRLSLPGGAGYGDPLLRDPHDVLADVVEGYVSIEAAKREYGVAVRYTGDPSRILQLPHEFVLDIDATNALRN